MCVVLCVAVYLSHACARVGRRARAYAASTRVKALGVRALCVVRRAREQSGRRAHYHALDETF